MLPPPPPPSSSHTLDFLHTPRRMLDGGWFLSPEGPYRSLEELWDTEHEEPTSTVGSDS
jgi:hypothetical protein